MKASVMIAVAMLGLSQNIFASDIEGVWKLGKSSCSSGAPVKSFSDQMSIDNSSVMKIDGKQIQAVMHMKVKYKPAYAAAMLKRLEDAQKQNQAQPASDEEKKAIKANQDAITQIMQYVGGIDCVDKEVLNYTLSGSAITTELVSDTGNCPSDNSGSKIDLGAVSVSGNTLTFTPSTPVEGDDEECPKGDLESTRLVRVK